MNNYKIIEVTTKEQIEKLSKEWALTFEGLIIDEEGIKQLLNWLDEHDALYLESTVDIYVIKGKLMNESYGLTESNAYPDDLSIVSVSNIDKKKLIFSRFEVGARWLNDIISNNEYTQYEINKGLHK